MGRARARCGDRGVVLDYRIVDGGWRGRAKACAGEGCCELGEDGPHTQRQVLHLAKAVHTLVSAPRENCGHHGSMQSTSASPQAARLSGTETAGKTETLGDLEPAGSTATRPARRSPSLFLHLQRHQARWRALSHLARLLLEIRGRKRDTCCKDMTAV